MMEFSKTRIISNNGITMIFKKLKYKHEWMAFSEDAQYVGSFNEDEMIMLMGYYTFMKYFE